MKRAEIDEGVRRMRFASLLERHERGEITQGEAAELLGVEERTFRRWRDRYAEGGEAGLADRRSPRRAPHLPHLARLIHGQLCGFAVTATPPLTHNRCAHRVMVTGDSGRR